MQLRQFLQTWQGLNRENLFHRAALGILAVALLVSQCQMMRDDQVVVLEPPMDLTERAKITPNGASDEYLRSWVLFIAQFLGNVTPDNAELVKEGLLPILSADVYNDIRQSLEQQVVEFRESGMSTSYNVRQIIYESETDKYFVLGQQTTRAPSAEPQTERRVYEIEMDIERYRPVVTYLAAYNGRPRTVNAKRRD